MQHFVRNAFANAFRFLPFFTCWKKTISNRFHLSINCPVRYLLHVTPTVRFPQPTIRTSNCKFALMGFIDHEELLLFLSTDSDVCHPIVLPFFKSWLRCALPLRIRETDDLDIIFTFLATTLHECFFARLQ